MFDQEQTAREEFEGRANVARRALADLHEFDLGRLDLAARGDAVVKCSALLIRRVPCEPAQSQRWIANGVVEERRLYGWSYCHNERMNLEIEPEQQLPAYYRRIKGSSATISLGSAMIAVGEILEPSKTAVEVEQVADDPHDPEDLNLSFGGLPELN